MDELTELEDSSVFKLVRGQTTLIDFVPGLIMSIPFEVDFDRSVIHRDSYTIIDVLSDIGGLNGLITSFLAVLVSILNHNNFDSFLASQLYSFSSKKQRKWRK